MKLGDIIKKYRHDNKLSLRDFAKTCGTSHSYIAMLEDGKNSKTGEPIVPAIVTLKKIATALNMSLNDLIFAADDMPVALWNSVLEPYGVGNPVPSFIIRGATLAEMASIGGGKHTRFSFMNEKIKEKILLDEKNIEILIEELLGLWVILDIRLKRIL